MEMAYSLRDIATKRRPLQAAVINLLSALVQRMWPGSRVEVFGSFATVQ